MSKRLMPTYLVNFLKEIYDGTIPSNFGKRMVSRQFIARVKELYETLGGANPSDYSRRMVNEYLIKFFNEIEIVEYTDDDVKMTKTISSDLVYPACRIDAIGGMSYVVDGVIQDSPVTSVKTYNTDNELLDTYTVPSEITSIEGYGQGINNNCYNVLDFETGVFTDKVIKVKLKDLNYAYVNGTFRATATSLKIVGGTDMPNILCNVYTTDIPNNVYNKVNDKTISVSTTIEQLWINDTAYTDPTVFKNHFSDNDYVYYELATPIETTITEQAPLLECVDNGSIVFENEYNQDMPNEVTTWIKES